MFNKIKEFFLGKPKAQEPVAEAPYKVEAPVVSVTEVAPAEAPVKPKKAPAQKPTVAAKKPRAKKTPAK